MLTIRGIPANKGVWLKALGSDRYSPQEFAFNTGHLEEREPNDGAFRSQFRNAKPGEVATIVLAPAQLFRGVVVIGDSGLPAANAPIWIYTCQQEELGSFVGVESRTDEAGRFLVNPYPGVRYSITAFSPPGSPYHTREVSELCWDAVTSRNMEIRLDRGVLARGIVVKAQTGQPVRGASVQYYPDNANRNLTPNVAIRSNSLQETNDAGEFAVVVIPGPGTLLVHAEERNYILQEMGSRELTSGKPGGTRNYAHAFRKIDPPAGEEMNALRIELEPGATVAGRLVDQAGKPIESALVASRLRITPSSPEWRGFTDEATNGEFEIQGLRAGEKYVISFLEPKGKLGATVTIDAATPSPKVVLAPCATAKARFVRSNGKPVPSGSLFALNMAVRAGPPRGNRQAYALGELAADEEVTANIDQHNHWPLTGTNDAGEIQFPALIPGATYRIVKYVDGDAHVAKEFVAVSGEIHDLGDIEVSDGN